MHVCLQTEEKDEWKRILVPVFLSLELLIMSLTQVYVKGK